MKVSSVFHQFPWVVYANSSSPGTYESTSEDEQSTSSQGNIGVSHVLSPQEISAQIIHVNPLLQTSTKHPHTPLIQGSIPKETAIATHSALSGLSPQKEKRLRELYERLDMDNDGTVDIRDLTAALKREMPHIPERLAPKLMARISAGNDDKVNFAEFVKYVVEHEKDWRLFSRIWTRIMTDSSTCVKSKLSVASTGSLSMIRKLKVLLKVWTDRDRPQWISLNFNSSCCCILAQTLRTWLTFGDITL